ELDVDAAPGTRFIDAVSVGDTRLVVDVLPNRPDLLSHLGLAREVAAVTGTELQLPDIGIDGIAIPEASKFRRAGNAGGLVLHLENAKLASRYMGVVIRGVKVAASPAWLVERLASVGSRSINNVVDATNYILHELGQPIHAFDLNKVDPEPKMPEKTIVVRSAKDGETLVTLDGVTHKLTAEMTVIADSVSPIALAGVMGGRDTEVGDDTTDVFVEVATFDTVATRRTRRVAGLSTDASYRFERGVDSAIAPRALERVSALIIALAGGEVVASPVDLHVGDTEPMPLVLRPSRVRRVLGVEVESERIVGLLRSIGCTAQVEDLMGSILVVAPSWRGDLAAEVDLIEEVARLHGYDALPDEVQPYRPGTSRDAPMWGTSARLRDVLVGEGLMEVRPTPFVSGGEGHVRVLNPLAENEGHLRRTLMESLARRAEHNLAHMQRNIRLFEVGSVFAPGDHVLPDESMRVAALVMGDREPAHFTNAKPPQYDAWDAKSLAERIGAALGAGPVELRPSDDDSPVLWTVLVNGEERGQVARVALDAPVWAAPAFGVEVSMGDVPNGDVAPIGEHAHGDTTAVAPRRARRFRPLPTTPASEFDLALLVPDGVLAADVENVISQAAGELLERLVAFDLYEGEGVEKGHRSVAWRLTLRHPERTLRDKEIEGRRAKILTALQNELNVRQRTT
ncbi:MAG: phenylalanine--tRNA ligase subunit beta, partial [Gemmatimonadaceae bacterium]